MKATEAFTNTINAHLVGLAQSDSLFAETFKKPNKNLDDCITYIFNTVKASGCNGFADEEIYNMAVHYYDEDSIVVGEKISGSVVVNHSLPAEKKAPITKTEPIKAKDKIKPTSTPAKYPEPKLSKDSQFSLFS